MAGNSNRRQTKSSVRQPGAALAFSGLPITARSVGMCGSGGTVVNEVGANKSMPSKASKAQPVALRVELLDIDPLIWRRIIVANNWTLASLHHYLQWVMGWSDTHAHEFHALSRRNGGSRKLALITTRQTIGTSAASPSGHSSLNWVSLANSNTTMTWATAGGTESSWRPCQSLGANLSYRSQFARPANMPAHQRMSVARMAIKSFAPPSVTLSMRSSAHC